MSAKLGFADAVRVAGDGWRTHAMCEAWKAGNQRLGDAFLLSDGNLRDEIRERVRLKRLVHLADVQARRARREVFAGVAA